MTVGKNDLFIENFCRRQRVNNFLPEQNRAELYPLALPEENLDVNFNDDNDFYGDDDIYTDNAVDRELNVRVHLQELPIDEDINFGGDYPDDALSLALEHVPNRQAGEDVANFMEHVDAEEPLIMPLPIISAEDLRTLQAQAASSGAIQEALDVALLNVQTISDERNAGMTREPSHFKKQHLIFKSKPSKMPPWQMEVVTGRERDLALEKDAVDARVSSLEEKLEGH
jgi:hypothetical protein